MTDVQTKPGATGTPRRGRRKKVEPAPEVVSLHLDAPTSIDGSRDTTLVNTVTKKYDQILILTPDGKKTHATLVDTDEAKVTDVGSLIINFVFALANAAFAGQGSGPDGSTLWIAKHAPEVVKTLGEKFPKYQLRFVPAGRSGTNWYQAPIADFINLAQVRAQIIEASLSMSGVAPTRQVERAKKDAPAVQISF